MPLGTRGGGGNHHPLRDPTPAGATDAGVGVRTESSRAPKARPLSEIAGTGVTPVPLRADPPAGATEAGRRPQIHSAAGERQGNETHAVTFFHSDQDAALTLRARARDKVTHVSGRRHGLAGNLEDHVASREPVVGGNAR